MSADCPPKGLGGNCGVATAVPDSHHRAAVMAAATGEDHLQLRDERLGTVRAIKAPMHRPLLRQIRQGPHSGGGTLTAAVEQVR